MKILVIDDEEDLRYIARLSLERLGGMTVLEAASGEEGLELAKQEQPDCILLDLSMPEMDGEATLAKLQRDEQTASIPVIFLTAVAVTQEVKRIAGSGARGLIRKPFEPRELAEALKGILAS